MSKGWSYVNGDWWLLCDVCNKKIKSSEAKQRWDGFIVCKDDFEQRHPQDFIRARADKISVPYTRPQTTDIFILTEGLQDGFTIEDLSYTYIDSTYFLSDYIQNSNFIITLSYHKTYSDSVSFTDAYKINDADIFTDSLTISDSKSFYTNKNFADSTTITDNGSVYFLDYIDATYFSGQYVGTPTTF